MLETQEYAKYHTRSELNKTIHHLEGLLKGIKIDGQVTPNEVDELKNWYSLNKTIFNIYPFSHIIETVEKAIDDNVLDQEELEDILWTCNNLRNIDKGKYYNVITSDIQRLHGILHGILADNLIDDDEIQTLKEWLLDNELLKNTYPYEEAYSLILGILQDGVVSEEERKILKVFFSDYIDSSISYNINQKEVDELKKEIHIDGICSIAPTIELQNNLFCFTGTSSKTTRKDFAIKIEKLGGKYKDTITTETKYLIVGNECNPCWAFSCYGRKIEKAMNLRKKGKEIIIVHENDFWDNI